MSNFLAAEASRRLLTIQPALSRMALSGLSIHAATAWLAGQLPDGPHQATLERWVRRYLKSDGDVSALQPRPYGRNRNEG